MQAYELSTLTGTQVLLLVASETGHVYTFATPKLQPLITKPEGKTLIQNCLNAAENPVPPPAATPPPARQTFPEANLMAFQHGDVQHALHIDYEKEEKNRSKQPEARAPVTYAPEGLAAFNFSQPFGYPMPLAFPQQLTMPPLDGFNRSAPYFFNRYPPYAPVHPEDQDSHAQSDAQ
jgi:hypothetical protein